VAGFGLRRFLAGRTTLPADLADATLRQEARLRGPIAALAAIGVLAPMIGLTGTVLGMSGAFTVLARTGTGDFPSLSGAIGRVLLSTAAGLLVAIPGFVFTYYFKSRQERAALFARRALSRLFAHLPAVGRPGAVRRPREDDPEFGLQIAPLLDLLFVLLLFFMIVAGSQRHEGEIGLAFNRAETAPAAPDTGEAARIDIDAEGQVFFNRLPCGNSRDEALPALREKLRAIDPSRLILITPQPRTRQDRIVAVLDACRESSSRRIAFGASGD
jgi:biopolymer transport protein ExbD